MFFSLKCPFCACVVTWVTCRGDARWRRCVFPVLQVQTASAHRRYLPRRSYHQSGARRSPGRKTTWSYFLQLCARSYKRNGEFLKVSLLTFKVTEVAAILKKKFLKLTMLSNSMRHTGMEMTQVITIQHKINESYPNYSKSINTQKLMYCSKMKR